jgi:hypothetical protein
LVRRKQYLNAARLAWRSLYESGCLKFEDHLVDGVTHDSNQILLEGFQGIWLVYKYQQFFVSSKRAAHRAKFFEVHANASGD